MNQPITEVGAAFRLPTTPTATIDDIPQQQVGSPQNFRECNAADKSKAGARTEHVNPTLDAEGAAALLSLSQGSATSVDDTERCEGSEARGLRPGGRLENYSLSVLLKPR